MKTIAELLDLNGKVAFVTGAAKGIGRGIAVRLAEAGATVIVADVDFAAATATAQDLVADGREAMAWKLDVASESEFTMALHDVAAEFGRIDILVNNAGVYPAMPVSELPVELFDHVLDVNLRSVFVGTKVVAEIMKQHGGGRIINVTSIDALHPSMIGLAHYDASKHGVWGFTKNAALELAPHHIAVNAIAPGAIATPGTVGPDVSDTIQANLDAFVAAIPLQRMGEPDDIGTVALFLASDMAAYLTGSQIVVDGGFLLT